MTVKTLTPNQIKEFQERVLTFYRENGRDLPWRKTTNPYHIYVSEVMLQQTLVKTVEKKYTNFIKRFPDLKSLANSSFFDILKEWKGLGFNRRALTMQKACIAMCSTHESRVPKTVEGLESLPGVGRATARSIYVFSYNLPEVFIETNIRRVFLHHFFIEQIGVDDKAILPYIQATLPKNDPKVWYWALMDYGSWLGRSYPNANLRSKIYKRQSKFEGSSRQTRGHILEVLLGEKDLTLDTLKSKVNKNPEHFQKAFQELVAEGFVKTLENGRVVLK